LNSNKHTPRINIPIKIDKLLSPINENNVEISFLINIDKDGFKRKPIPDIEAK